MAKYGAVCASLHQMLPRDVPPARLRHQNVVLDPYPAHGGELVDELPVEAAGVLVFAEGAQQHGDEVEAGLDSEELAGLDGAGGAQVGVLGGGRLQVALGVGQLAGHIVHLQAQVVAQAVGVEGPRQAQCHSFAGLGLEDAALFEEGAQFQVAAVVQVAEGLAGLDLGAQLLLQLLHARHQRLEARIALGRGGGAGDVGGVAQHVGAAVQQQQLAVLEQPLALVVQGGALLVEGDDAGEGQFVVQTAHALDEGEVDLQLRSPGQERGPAGAVALGSQHGGILGALHFVGALVAAAPIQVGGEAGGIDLQAGGGGAFGLIADVSGAGGLAHGFPHGLHRGAFHQVKAVDPERRAAVEDFQRHLLVPEIFRRVAEQLGLLSRHQLQRVVGSPQRAVVEEMRCGAERRVLVIGEVGVGLSRRNHHRVEAGRRQGLLRPGEALLQVLGEQGLQVHGFSRRVSFKRETGGMGKKGSGKGMARAPRKLLGCFLGRWMGRGSLGERVRDSTAFLTTMKADGR